MGLSGCTVRADSVKAGKWTETDRLGNAVTIGPANYISHMLGLIPISWKPASLFTYTDLRERLREMCDSSLLRQPLK